MTYSARDYYGDQQVVDSYEADRFSTRLGARRWMAEQDALRQMFDLLPANAEVLDCPVGNGRWADQLVHRGHRVTGVDVSKPMLAAAAARLGAVAEPGRQEISLLRMSAEHLAFPDRSFEIVFSHALTKHLPNDLQDRVFAEFARVARAHIVCSFSVLSGVRGLIWRVRRLEDAYGRTPASIRCLAAANGFSVRASFPCTTAAGAERTVLFSRE